LGQRENQLSAISGQRSAFSKSSFQLSAVSGQQKQLSAFSAQWSAASETSERGEDFQCHDDCTTAKRVLLNADR